MTGFEDSVVTVSQIQSVGGWHLLTTNELQVLSALSPDPRIGWRAAEEIHLRDTLRDEARRG